MIKEEKAIR